MKEKTVSVLMLTLLLVSVLVSAVSIQLVKASGTIYIRADGSIDPPTAPIFTTDSITYTFTSDISDEIVVERSNIIVDGAGYTLQGSGWGEGFYWSGINNVTIKNANIKNFERGIWPYYSSNNTVSGNNITENNYAGIRLDDSSNNTISGNNITNSRDGIGLYESSNITISGNNITENDRYGIYLYGSSNNSISGNNIKENNYDGIFNDGIVLACGNNTISGNNIKANGRYGIRFAASPNNTLVGNKMVGNRFNFRISGSKRSHFVNDIDTSNTVDGKPVYYWLNKQDLTIPLDAGCVVLVNCTGITVQNLNLISNGQGIILAYTTNSTITNSTITANDYYGIQLYYSSNVIISENNIKNTFWFGIRLDYSFNNTISGNNITENGEHGIDLHYSSYNNTISGNNITENSNCGVALRTSNNIISGNNITENGDEGIHLYSGNNNTISRNTIKNNGWGIVFNSSFNNTISGNNITNNIEGIWLSESSNNTISGNNIKANNYYGLKLSESSNVTISENNITETNFYGIHLYYASNVTISGNNITENSNCGIRLDYSSNNRIYQNDFDNTLQVYIPYSGYSNVWDDGYPSGGNYWSDYTGADVKSGPNQDQPGSDGIGDTPYVIDADNQDRYPLVAHDIAVTEVKLFETVVGEGYNLNINVTAANQGHCTETFNVTLYANTTTIGIQTVTNLTAGSTQVLTFPWNTTGFAKGNYTITAKATQLPDETDTLDNTFIDGWITVTILGDVNGDREVDVFDKVIVGAAFGATYNATDGMYWHQPPDFTGPCLYCPHTPNADINGDGIIDIYDKVIVGYHFGETDL